MALTKKISIQRKTHELDAKGHVLGRLATRIAHIIRGKNKASYQPHLDCGDTVVVKNVKEIALSGRKIEQKVYYRYSGYPGGLKKENIADVMKKKPGEILRKAVYNMLPPTRLRKNMMKRLIIE